MSNLTQTSPINTKKTMENYPVQKCILVKESKSNELCRKEGCARAWFSSGLTGHNVIIEIHRLFYRDCLADEGRYSNRHCRSTNVKNCYVFFTFYNCRVNGCKLQILYSGKETCRAHLPRNRLMKYLYRGV